MNEKKDLNSKDFSLIKKTIQNEIRDIIIDKLLSTIMKQNLEIIILKEKYESIEKIANKSLKKLMSILEHNPKKNNLNTQLIQDLNVSGNDLSNSTQIFSARDSTLVSDLDSTILLTNFSPEPKIECKRIIFKKGDNKIRVEKNKKKYLPPKSSNNKQSISYLSYSKTNLNSLNMNNNNLNKRKKNNINSNDNISSSYGEKKINIKNSFVKFEQESNQNNSHLNNSKKGNYIESYFKRSERCNSVKSNNINDDIITNSFEDDNKKNKKYLEYYSNSHSKILNSCSSKGVLNSNGQKIKHIKTVTDIESFHIQNPFKSLKKNYSQTGKKFSLDKNLISRSPQITRNNIINDNKNSSVVKISLASENYNSNNNNIIVDRKSIKTNIKKMNNIN